MPTCPWDNRRYAALRSASAGKTSELLAPGRLAHARPMCRMCRCTLPSGWLPRACSISAQSAFVGIGKSPQRPACAAAPPSDAVAGPRQGAAPARVAERVPGAAKQRENDPKYVREATASPLRQLAAQKFMPPALRAGRTRSSSEPEPGGLGPSLGMVSLHHRHPAPTILHTRDQPKRKSSEIR